MPLTLYLPDLLELDAHLLADVGLAREDAVHGAPFQRQGRERP